MMPAYLLVLITYFTAGANSRVAVGTPVSMSGSLRVQYVATWLALSSLKVSEPLKRPIMVVMPSYWLRVLITLLSPTHRTSSSARVLLDDSLKFLILNSRLPAVAVSSWKVKASSSLV